MENKTEGFDSHHESDAFTGGTFTPTNAHPTSTAADTVAEKDHVPQDGLGLENGKSGDLRPEHREYLMSRHGTTALEPLPAMDPADPLNKHYNVTPIVGEARAAFGNQMVTTVLVTYAVDCHHEHAASVGVFINLVRSTWGFIGPFWFPSMFSRLGLIGSGGLMVGRVVVFAILPVIFIPWKGAAIRERRASNELGRVNTITR